MSATMPSGSTTQALWLVIGLSVMNFTPTFAFAQVAAKAVDRLVRQAQTLLEAGDNEGASQLLRRASRQILVAGTDPGRLSPTIRKLLGKTDKHLAKRRKGLATAARLLVTEAKRFKSMKWHHLAIESLWEAERFDRKLVAYHLASVRRATPEVFSFAVEARKKRRQPIDTSGPEFEPLGSAAEHFLWKLAPRVVTSPTLGAKGTPIILYETPKHDDCVISVEVKRASKKSKAGLLFGGDDYENYYIYELQFLADDQVRAIAFRCKALAVSIVGHADLRMTEAQRSDWVRYGVRIEGKKLNFFVGEKAVFSAGLDAPAHGMAGFHVSASSANKEPVQFRGLVFLPLKTPGVDAPHPLSVELAAAAQALHEGAAEKAIHAVLRTRLKLLDVADAKTRGTVLAESEAILKRGLPKHEAFAKRRAKAAAELVGLAAAYQKMGWRQTAHELLRDAVRLSESTARGALIASTAARERSAAEASAKKEPRE